MLKNKVLKRKYKIRLKLKKEKILSEKKMYAKVK